MRLLLAVAAALVCSGVAQATPAFTQLQAWYRQGQPITLNELDGFYSGRCFSAGQPDHALSAMIGFYTRTVGENQGPAFPSQHPETKVFTVEAWTKPADYFDNDALFPQLKKEFINEAKNHWRKMSSPSNSPTLSWTNDWEVNGRPDEKHSVVRYNEYFIETWSALLGQDYGDWGFHKAGDTLAMCYYFKLLQD